MKKYLITGLALLIVVANVAIGHFFPPFGIMLTPFVLPIITMLVVFGPGTRPPISVSGLVVGLIALNDIGIKLFSGGTHDSEGLGWIHGTLIIGLLPSFLLLLAGNLQNHQAKRLERVLGALLFPALITVHLCIFGHLGYS